jgi:glycosyltransferase involved in cell wall biosynthesis
MSRLKLIVIIPAYNEEDSLPDLLGRMPDLAGEEIRLLPVVIDDGSHDRTGEYARLGGAIVLRHETNLGLGKTFRDGLEYAFEQDADILVNIDADLQYDPADIPKLIRPILEHKADFVTADRFSDESGRKLRPAGMPAVKYWGNQVMTRLVNALARTSLGDVSSGFRAYNREAILNLNLTGKYTYTHETILDLAFKRLRLASVPIPVRYFPERKSRIASNLLHYTNQTLRIILKAFRDYRPFYFFGLLALGPFVVGAGLSLFMLYFYLRTGDFTPYKFVGFIGVYLLSLALVFMIIGFLADILVGIRLTAEKQLYLQKKAMQKTLPGNLPQVPNLREVVTTNKDHPLG